ncbi:c-type cytochrome [Chitinophaga solisilvae]|uniref:C-type cytochrome n=1 Tax=Chitinophaga solisilvae TaxID=1233460 RepID=A0A433WIS3_9BACT|nr:c-type cytochrome [Chitinophaga solisilvae]NSL88863.1 c-type cytochrome [Chitinophaga solisilvae]
MKKWYLVMAGALFFAACGGGENKTETKQSSQESAAADNSMVSPNAGKPASKGETLMAESDCKTCHKEEMKVVGPSLKDIAGKYPNTPENIDKLAQKVIKGGSGNWGDVAMLPHPNISQEDAKEMVSYILSLSGK